MLSILAGGSYAALRDLAEYGAALYFDDAESFAAGRGDALRRELLLSGSRRGARVPLKTPQGHRWVTRWVSTFTPRAFSAISAPDPTLLSRAIVLPLDRTADPLRGNRDPADPAAWPFDRLALQDDLWALALHLLPRAPSAWHELGGESDLVGRPYQPWRPLLAVARLLQPYGVGVEQELRAAMAAYQSAGFRLSYPDETLEVVRALVCLFEYLVCEAARATRRSPGVMVKILRQKPPALRNESLLYEVRKHAPDGALACRGDRGAATRIGQIMSRLRFVRERTPGADRSRGWQIPFDRVLDLARTYGIPTDLSTCAALSRSNESSRSPSDTSDTSPAPPRAPK